MSDPWNTCDQYARPPLLTGAIGKIHGDALGLSPGNILLALGRHAASEEPRAWNLR